MADRRLADVLPVAPAQEGLLFHALLSGAGTDVYQVQCRFAFDAPVDAGALRAAVTALLDRHPNLRACFRQLGTDRPVQVVPERVSLPWTEVDLPAEGTEAADGLRRVLAGDLARRFDLTRPPLLRATLVRYGTGSAELVLTVHHILMDGWSMPILADELARLYRGDSLPPAPRFRDYLAWLRGCDHDAALTVWRAALAGARPTMLCPAAGRGDTLPEIVEVVLEAGTTEALRGRAAAAGVTVNTLVQVAWALVLARTTGTDDVVFGAVVSGRPAELPGAERMVGLLINTVPVRVRLVAGETADHLVRRVQAEQAHLVAHHHLPLAETQRAAGTGELFDTVLAFESFPQPTDPSPGGPRLIEVRDATHYPLTLTVLAGDRLTVRLGHRPDLLPAPTTRLLAARLRHALDLLSGPLDAAVDGLDVLPATERAELVPAPAPPDAVAGEPVSAAGSAHGGAGRPHPATIPEVFAGQVARTPRAVAVRCGGRNVDYAQLADRAGRLAARLAEAGVTVETPVAVLLDRSVELVAAQLAVLVAGGCFVPLDGAQPPARLARLVCDSGARVLLAERRPGWLPETVRFVPVVAEVSGAAVVEAGSEVAAARSAAVEAGPAGARGLTDGPVEGAGLGAVRADSAAYVMFTSGSTGEPKGVVVTHGNVVDLATDPRFAGGAHRRVLFHSPHTFDAATYEVWVPLLTGGTVVVAPPGPLDPGSLAATLADGAVTALWLTAELLHAVADLAPRSLSGLTELWAGGDVLAPASVARVQRACPELTVVNGYGPTETTTFATCHRVDRPAPTTPVPIGTPLAGTRAYVLDALLRPAPIGTAGELYLAGAGLARGYAGRPARTAERFVADPYGPPGARMYRTGDRARWAIEGGLEFLGRVDAQVKIRGHRVEPAEVEAALESCPQVERAIVAARRDPAGGLRLVAFVVSRSTDPVAEVRAHAARLLPRHLLPAAYVVLDRLPLTAHGKVDRSALPADPPDHAGTPAGPPGRRVAASPGGGGAAATGTGSALAAAGGTGTAVRDTMCELFGAALGVAVVRPDDDFFDLGGHSLLAMRLVAAIRQRMGVHVPISALFAAPTPAALAERVGTAMPDLGTDPLVTLRAGNGRTPLFCMPPGSGYGQEYSRVLPFLSADRPVHALQVPRLGGDPPLPGTVEELTTELLKRITAVQRTGPYLLMGRSFGGLLAYEAGVQLRAAGQPVALVAVLDSLPGEGPAEAIDEQLVEDEVMRIMLHHGRAATPATLARSEVLPAVAAGDGTMHGWSLRRLAGVADFCGHGIRLANAYRPAAFDGPVHLFSGAAEPHAPSGATKLATWRRVTPDVRFHEIDCKHSDMILPEHLATIFAILDPVLREV